MLLLTTKESRASKEPSIAFLIAMATSASVFAFEMSIRMFPDWT